MALRNTQMKGARKYALLLAEAARQQTPRWKHELAGVKTRKTNRKISLPPIPKER